MLNVLQWIIDGKSYLDVCCTDCCCRTDCAPFGMDTFSFCFISSVYHGTLCVQFFFFFFFFLSVCKRENFVPKIIKSVNCSSSHTISTEVRAGMSLQLYLRIVLHVITQTHHIHVTEFFFFENWDGISFLLFCVVRDSVCYGCIQHTYTVHR